MTTALEFGLNNLLISQVESQLGLPHKAPVADLPRFLDVLAEVIRSQNTASLDVKVWNCPHSDEQLPKLPRQRHDGAARGRYLPIPNAIDPIHLPPPPALTTALSISSPVNANGAVIEVDGFTITLGYGAIFE